MNASFIKEDGTVDVREIMQKVHERAEERKMNDTNYSHDVTRIQSHQLRTYWSGLGGSGIDEYQILDKLELPRSHRRSLMGKVANFVLGKLFLATKSFLGELLSVQEQFNMNVSLEVNKLIKKNRELESKINEYEKNNSSIST